MTRDDVIQSVMRIEASVADAELAHGLEDELFRAVLTAIAQGAPNPAELAMLALYSLMFEFRRDCA